MYKDGHTNRYKADHYRKVVWFDLNGSLRESEKRCLVDAGYKFLRGKDAKVFNPKTRKFKAQLPKQLKLWT